MDVAAVHYRVGRAEDDDAITRHFCCMWLDLGVPSTDIQPDWAVITHKFIAEARHSLQYRAFIAEVEGEVVGSAGGQLFNGLYPAILTPANRQYGYMGCM